MDDVTRNVLMSALSLNRTLSVSLFLTTLTSLMSSMETTSPANPTLRIFTVANEVTDGLERFNRSANVYGHRVDILGMGRKEGKKKVGFFKDALKSIVRDEPNSVLLFVGDCDNVILTGGSGDILSSFNSLNTNILFPTQSFWLADKFLEPSVFIGYADSLWDMLSYKGDVDDQFFYFNLYLNELGMPNPKLGIELDPMSHLFHVLDSEATIREARLKFGKEDTVVKNVTRPSVIIAKETGKQHLDGFGNYLAKRWVKGKGCQECVELDKTEKSPSDLGHLVIGIFVERPTPFLREFFEDIVKLNVIKEKTTLVIHSNVKYHEKLVKEFVDKANVQYLSIKVLDPDMKEAQARTTAMEECLSVECDFYLSLDSTARLTNPEAVTSLAKQDKELIAPMIRRPGKRWANFWGSLSVNGSFERSFDYVDIVTGKRKGVWNVPHIFGVYLIKGDLLRKGLSVHKDDKGGKVSTYPSFTESHKSLRQSFSFSLRKAGVFLYVSNLAEYGYLVNPDNFNITNVNPDFYDLKNNRLTWERRYLHPEYDKVSKLNITDALHGTSPVLQQPCPDVYWFPVVTEEFCDNLVEIMESYGKWSPGTHYDERFKGDDKFEAAPTRDIHMDQVGLQEMWLAFLTNYISPIQEKIYEGYFSDEDGGPESEFSFVVRYKLDEQPELKPHHDTSTYTVNIALNRKGVDYEGGGCHFLRYNCSVTDTKKGWTMIHPGKLTHYHEGLRITKGTRYIMVSFVDP